MKSFPPVIMRTPTFTEARNQQAYLNEEVPSVHRYDK